MSNKKKKFEVKMGFNEDDKTFSQNIYVNGIRFPWSINEKDFSDAMKSNDPQLIAYVQADIVRHFLQSLSEFLERPASHPVTTEELEDAKKTGWIE